MTIQTYENKLADLSAKHNIEMYEKENEFQKLISERESEYKHKMKKLQTKYEMKLQDLVVKLNSFKHDNYSSDMPEQDMRKQIRKEYSTKVKKFKTDLFDEMTALEESKNELTQENESLKSKIYRLEKKVKDYKEEKLKMMNNRESGTLSLLEYSVTGKYAYCSCIVRWFQEKQDSRKLSWCFTCKQIPI